MSYDHLWTELFRPKTLKDLCISDENRKIVESFGDEIPHLLLVGSPGTGKTTLARIIALDILKCDYLYINASDENGIDTIRNKVTGFVQTKSFDGRIKLVILDEADSITRDGQKCLRNLMESYAETSRFILTGNYKHKIIDALRSRCQSLDIKPTLSQAFNRCVEILTKSGVKITKTQSRDLAVLVKSHFPDLRMCIGEMQKFCSDNELNITQKVNNSELCDKIFLDIQSGDTLPLRQYLIENDYVFNSDWEDLLSDLLNHVYTIMIDDSKKKAMILTIADHLEKCSRVNDKEINFFACVLNLENV